jgi:excisionase family DNA binding protein
LLENQQVADHGLSRVSPGIAPNSQPFGAIVVQETSGAEGRGSTTIGPFLTIREVAARLRVCTATVYSLCESGGLAHLRVNNAIRVAEADLGAFIRSQGRSPRR